MMHTSLAPPGKVAEPLDRSYVFHPQLSCLIPLCLMFSTGFMDFGVFSSTCILVAALYLSTGTSSSFFMSVLSQILFFSGFPNGRTDSPPTSVSDIFPLSFFPLFKMFKAHSVSFTASFDCLNSLNAYGKQKVLQRQQMPEAMEISVSPSFLMASLPEVTVIFIFPEGFH